VLAATERLFASRSASEVTLDEIACEAGVSKATVLRRFGDRAGLLLALLDEHERALQDEVLRGPPPVGPGAEPQQRLTAFLHLLLELSVTHADLLLASETAKPLTRYRTGAYAAWHRHVAILLAQLAPRAPAGVLAHVLLAPLTGELVTHLIRDRQTAPADLDAALASVVASLAEPAAS